MIAAYRRSRAARGIPSSAQDLADAIVTASRFRIPATRLCEARGAHPPKAFLYPFGTWPLYDSRERRTMIFDHHLRFSNTT